MQAPLHAAPVFCAVMLVVLDGGHGKGWAILCAMPKTMNRMIDRYEIILFFIFFKLCREIATINRHLFSAKSWLYFKNNAIT